MPRTALVIGATGLVGRAIVRQLLEHPRYDRVVVLARRPLEWQHPRLLQEQLDFDHPNPDLIRGDDLYCAMGTTLRKAGSQPAQYLIDCTYPYEIGKIAKANGVQRYLLVSSIGADAHSGNFYLRTKGELEEKIAGLDFHQFVSARPSFLLGQREEFRMAERIGIAMERVFRPLVPRKYRGIQAEQVARALIHLACADISGQLIVESDRLQEVD
jgi:uncharacterized protein YbjT (DUF2867 family)